MMFAHLDSHAGARFYWARIFVVVFLFTLSTSWVGAQERTTLEELQKFVDKDVEVEIEFTVKRTAVAQNRTIWILNSVREFPTRRNFAVVIPKEVIKQMQRKGLAEQPESYFRGRVVTVTGKVKTYKKSMEPQIKISDASQIRWHGDEKVAIATHEEKRDITRQGSTYFIASGLFLLCAGGLLRIGKHGK